jgi:RNA methyltransferase, TrmH family
MKFNKTSNRIQTLVRKLTIRKHRERESLFLAEGERCVVQILERGLITIEEVIIADNYTPSDEIQNSGINISVLSSDEFKSISNTETPQGIIALCRMPDMFSIHDLPEMKGLLIALDALQDPGNLGTIIRTAAWFGASGILAGKGTADPWHPKVVRSTAGATGSIPLISGTLEKFFHELEHSGWEILLLDSGENSVSLHEARTAEKTVLVVGNEANGIDPKLLASGRKKIRIDGNPAAVESLNAAIAAGIAMYHLQGL